MNRHYSRYAVALAAVIGATSFIWNTEAIIDGKPVSREEYPQVFATLSTVIFKSIDESCSAVLVAPRLLLTAGHCAHDGLHVRGATNPYEMGRSQRRTGALMGKPKKWAAHPLYEKTESYEDGNISELARKAAYDIGYIVLEDSIALTPSNVGDYPTLDSAITGLLNQDATIVGYGGDEDLGSGVRNFNDFGTKRTGVKPIRGILKNSLIFEGPKQSAVPGDSGGPIYAKQNGQQVVVGISSRFGRFSDGSYAYLAASLLRKETLCWVEKDSRIDIPSVDCTK